MPQLAGLGRRRSSPPRNKHRWLRCTIVHYKRYSTNRSRRLVAFSECLAKWSAARTINMKSQSRRQRRGPEHLRAPAPLQNAGHARPLFVSS
ncbi:hypothetical protein EVAR_85363_1 [Eumeta japonica]|uniref:Uncharacterized protein n=1 Tax=Eumeta variegata TaxID=151549 RepID=A0A4C1WT86_EUMVA|nr:hypothetical protein EVAR_85363_1 [Eumeta japonica]